MHSGSDALTCWPFCVCVAALAVFWLWFDRWLLSEARYDLRTVLLVGIPIARRARGAAGHDAEESDRSPFPFLLAAGSSPRSAWQTRAATDRRARARALVHAVGDGEIRLRWTQYKSRHPRARAGDGVRPAARTRALFVSSERVAPDLNRLDWNSTMPFLSVLVVPDLAPARLVVDPSAGLLLALVPDGTRKRGRKHGNPRAGAEAHPAARLPAPAGLSATASCSGSRGRIA